MILRQTHYPIYVIDQEESLEFYRDKLGFEVRTDMTMDNGFRWLTIGPKSQPDFEINLMAIQSAPGLDPHTAEQLRSLVQKGTFGVGVFETDYCRVDYEAWSKLGVEFMQPPQEQFYGIEAIIKDNSGNWFSLTERKR
jgi:catechol 2,3-dioxygenase-like lactoylglutathione lyase family enzyme